MEYEKREHTRLHHSLSVIDIITFELKTHLLIFDEPEKIDGDVDRPKTAAKIEKRSYQLYASRTTKLRTQMSSSSAEQSRAAESSSLNVLFLC